MATKELRAYPELVSPQSLFGPGVSARKIIALPISKEMEKTDNGLLIRGFFTSDNRDEVGDIITRNATERAVPKYRQWGNIRYMHQPRPVGKVTRIGSDDGLEWNEVEFLVVDPGAIFEVENGLLKALSIGAMIRFEDIEFLEDGGWIINDYSLAEISLVDHPANYDATLNLGEKQFSPAELMLIRANGLGQVARFAPEILHKSKEDNDMTVENTTNASEESLEAGMVDNMEELLEEEAVEEQETQEEIDAEETPESIEDIVEEEVEVEASLEATETEEITDEEDAEIETESEEIQEEQAGPEQEEETLEPMVSLSLKDLNATMANLTALVKSTTELARALVAEAHSANEQSEDEGNGVDDDAGSEGNPSVATDRGAVPSTEIPEDDEVAEIEADLGSSRPADLRDAIRKRFGIETE